MRALAILVDGELRVVDEEVDALAQGDEARAAELQEEMGMEGAEEVGAFMASAFQCGAAEAEAQGM